MVVVVNAGSIFLQWQVKLMKAMRKKIPYRIESPQNEHIKALVKLLGKTKERQRKQVILVEGYREIDLALQADVLLDTLYYCEGLLSDLGRALMLNQPADRVQEIAPAIFAKLSYRKQSDGLLALLKKPKRSLSELVLPENPLLLVVEAVEKPGNLGAILRSADAAAVTAVLICEPQTDLYNPNVIRASLGAIFTVPVYACSRTEAIDYLKEKQITAYAASLQAKESYSNVNFKESCAIVLGSEADGLSDELTAACRGIKIPMKGKLDSLNVSAAAAILTFEALRQRGFL